MFVEKEGFDELLAQAQIAERFDLAIMSTKGVSNVAARRLVDELSCQGVTMFVLHDFDKWGLGILHTLRTDARRYRFRAVPNVIDLGLTLDDVQAMGLESEVVHYRQSDVFVEWLERRLTGHGVKKLVSKPETLANAYQRAVRTHTINKATERVMEEMTHEEVSIPDDLTEQVRARLEADPSLSWDAALWKIVNR